jgi:hypothetical protein
MNYIDTLALHYESRPKKFEINFEHFSRVVWHQITNKCYNIDVWILINAETLTSRVAN